MSFSFDAKTEVVNGVIPTKKCCCIAELTGIIRTCGNIGISNKQFSVVLNTDIPSLCSRIEKLLEVIYQTRYTLTLTSEERPNHTLRYVIILPTELSNKVLQDCQIVQTTYNNEMEIRESIGRSLIENECCQKRFVCGVFIGCVSANIVIKDIKNLRKHTGGYHLEFVFSNHALASDFQHILSQFNIWAKSMQRKKFFVVYIKEAEIVSDLLALVGANNAVMTLQSEFAVREVRNNLNRQLNCMNSNLTKMVDASIKQIDAIEYINNTIGLDGLTDNLYELCMLRLANPEETLDNLAKLMNPPLTKSGVNHRLRKIVKLAEVLREEHKGQ